MMFITAKKFQELLDRADALQAKVESLEKSLNEVDADYEALHRILVDHSGDLTRIAAGIAKLQASEALRAAYNPTPFGVN